MSAGSQMDLWQVISLYCLLPTTMCPKVESIPGLSDFNVLEPFEIPKGWESTFKEARSGYYQGVTLGVGLHSGYGPAQRLYVKRGYIPDGSRVWFNVPLACSSCENNDDLVLYFSKG